MVHSRRVQSLLRWIQPQTYSIFGVTVRDPIIKTHVLSRKVGQWGMCELHQTSLHLRVSARFALGWWDLLSQGKVWGCWLVTPSPSGPLTSHCNGSTEAACWGCCRQFAVSPGWTPRNALFLLQCNPTSPWTAQSLPADQPGLPCPAGVGQESGKRDCCDYFDQSQRNSPFALAILRYVRIGDMGNVCNSTAQPSQNFWDRSRVAHLPGHARTEHLNPYCLYATARPCSPIPMRPKLH